MVGGIGERAGGRVAPRRALADRQSSGCSRSTSSGSAPSSRSSSRGRCCSATCSATSSTATASWRRSPTAGRRSWPAARRTRAQRRRPADRRPRPPLAQPDVLRRGRRLAGAARAPARVGFQALPPLRPRLWLQRRLPCSPRPLQVPELRAGAAGAVGGGHRRRAARHQQCGLHARGAPRRAAAPGPVQRLQRARRRGAHARSASSWTTWSPGWRRRAGVRARGDARPRPPHVGCCWSRTRPARTRCCARWRSKAGSWTCWAS